MNSRIVTNILLGVIALSLAGPHVNRWWKENRRMAALEEIRRENCKRDTGDWGIYKEPASHTRYVLTKDFAMANCLAARPATKRQREIVKQRWERRAIEGNCTFEERKAYAIQRHNLDVAGFDPENDGKDWHTLYELIENLGQCLDRAELEGRIKPAEWDQ